MSYLLDKGAKQHPPIICVRKLHFLDCWLVAFWPCPSSIRGIEAFFLVVLWHDITGDCMDE